MDIKPKSIHICSAVMDSASVAMQSSARNTGLLLERGDSTHISPVHPFREPLTPISHQDEEDQSTHQSIASNIKLHVITTHCQLIHLQYLIK